MKKKTTQVIAAAVVMKKQDVKKELKTLILNVKMIYKVPLKKKKKLRITNKF